MAITPQPGYMVDPNNPNGVVKIGSVNPNTNIAYGNAPTATPQGTIVQSPTGQPTNATVIHNSSQIASTPSPYYPPTPTPQPTNISTPPATPQSNPTTSTSPATTGNTGLIPTAIPTGTDTSRSGLLTSQATTSNTDPTQTPAFQQQQKAYNDANATYQALQAKIQQFNGAAGISSDVAGTVTGREAVFAQSLAGQLDAAAQTMTRAQSAMNTLVSAYSAQTGAKNQTTTQTNPSNATQQVSSNTTVLGADGQPIATTPLIETAGIPGSYNGIPTTYNNGQVNPTSGSNPSAYNVVKGDTLSAIATRNGVSLADLEAANPQIKDFNKIEIGDQINLPKSATSAFDAGTVAGQKAAGENIVAQKSAYAQAQTIHSQISSLLSANPNLNSNPTAIGNAINQWANSTQVPSGPYVNLLNDLQEYANTIAPVLGVGGAPTDNKTAIANNLIPMLASGQTIDQALTNLEILAAGKITAAQTVGQNPKASVQSPVTGNMKVNSTTGNIYDF